MLGGGDASGDRGEPTELIHSTTLPSDLGDGLLLVPAATPTLEPYDAEIAAGRCHLPSDFYCEADVTRGCNGYQLPRDADELLGGGGPHGGYTASELDDAFRGSAAFFAPQAPPPSCFGDVGLLGAQTDASCVGGGENQWRSVGWSDEVAPMEVDRSMLAPTTVFLTAKAADAAACVHDFLTTQVNASFQKVRPDKLTFKADVFEEVGGYMRHCTLKARVFRATGPVEPSAHENCPANKGEGGLAVEFQRRAGDAVAFQHLFQRARGFLRSRLSATIAAEPQEEAPVRGLGFGPPVPAPAEAATDAEAATNAPAALTQPPLVAEPKLQPLVDMLADASAPQAQAEAATALAAWAGASPAGAGAIYIVLVELCGLRVELLASLLMHSQLAVSFAVARLLSTLARQSEGRLARASGELLTVVCRSDAAHRAAPLVREELAAAQRLVAAGGKTCRF